jgi:hypothetical protein
VGGFGPHNKAGHKRLNTFLRVRLSGGHIGGLDQWDNDLFSRLYLDSFYYSVFNINRGVTKRCRLSWLTSSAHVYEPKCGGGGVLRGPSQRKDIYIEHRAGKAPRLASWRKMTQPGEFCW